MMRRVDSYTNVTGPMNSNASNMDWERSQPGHFNIGTSAHNTDALMIGSQFTDAPLARQRGKDL